MFSSGYRLFCPFHCPVLSFHHTWLLVQFSSPSQSKSPLFRLPIPNLLAQHSLISPLWTHHAHLPPPLTVQVSLAYHAHSCHPLGPVPSLLAQPTSHSPSPLSFLFNQCLSPMASCHHPHLLSTSNCIPVPISNPRLLVQSVSLPLISISSQPVPALPAHLSSLLGQSLLFPHLLPLTMLVLSPSLLPTYCLPVPALFPSSAPSLLVQPIPISPLR